MSKRKELQLEILKNYFTFDGNVATLKLVYDTFAELINPNFGDDKIEKLNDKLFSDIQEAVSFLPRNYKLNLHIVIKNFGEYKKEECENIIKQNISLFAYQIVKRNNKKRASGWTLIGIGAAVLLASYFLRKYELWFDLVNISGTLFVWEGVNTTFIERSQENKTARALARAIKQITVESENKTKNTKTEKIKKQASK